MARRDDGKDAALAASRTLNSDPQKVTDPAFAAGGFFDPADLLQVKYEMVRRSRWTACRYPRRPRVRVRAPERLQRPGGAGGRRAGRADPGQARAQGRAQAHRAGAGPSGGPAGARSPADVRRAGRAGRAAVRHPGASPLGAPGAGTAVRRSRGRDRRTGGAQKRPARLTAAARRTSRDRCPGQAQIRRPCVMRPCARSRWPAPAAAGGTSCPCWPPGEWRPGWPRSPPAPAPATSRQQRCRRPPVPVRPRPCPARYQHERR